MAPNVSLDREKQPSYTFTVIAADQPQGSEEQKRSSALVITQMIKSLSVNNDRIIFRSWSNLSM